MIPFLIVAVAGYAIYAIKKCNSDDNKVHQTEAERGTRSTKGEVERARTEALKGFGNTKFINK